MKSARPKTVGNSLTLTVDDLAGKQSVRATFKLPPQIIDLLGIIAGQLGIKQKSLFDQLVENSAILRQVAKEARNFPESGPDRHQKTFVISKSTLQSLNRTAREQKVPRDVLVEAYIRQLMPVIKTELAKHRKRKLLLDEMQDYLESGRRLLVRTEKLLGKNDPLYIMLANQMTMGSKNASTLDEIIKRGMPMEEW